VGTSEVNVPRTPKEEKSAEQRAKTPLLRLKDRKSERGRGEGDNPALVQKLPGPDAVPGRDNVGQTR